MEEVKEIPIKERLLKQAVYFYKEDGHNVALLVGDYNDLKTVFFISDQELEHMINKFPQAKDNLFVLVDGMIFKLVT